MGWVKRPRRVTTLLLLLLALSAPAASHAASADDGEPQRAGQVVGADPNPCVTRTGSQLLLEGRPWRFAGVNMYWLGLDDNIRDGAGPTYPTRYRIDKGFDAARRVGARVVRAHTLGVFVSCARVGRGARPGGGLRGT